MKILGFIFGTDPDVGEHVKALSLKFRKRVWVLRHLKKSGIPTTDLVKLYQSLVAPVLDYTSVVYHSMLNKSQVLMLENLQKLALKIIYGVYEADYQMLLNKSGIKSLEERRLGFIDGFINKALAHPVYCNWFPTREFEHYDMRREVIYEEKFARTKRLYNSPLFYFRRRLNHTSRTVYN